MPAAESRWMGLTVRHEGLASGNPEKAYPEIHAR